MKIGTLDGATSLITDSEIVMNMTMFLHEGSKALTDIIISSKRLAIKAVVVAFTSNLPNMSDLTMATYLEVEATAKMPEDTNAILTEKRSWRAKPVVVCYIST